MLSLEQKHQALGDAVTWRELAKLSIPRELIATPDAVARVIAWVRGGGLEHEPPRLRDVVPCYGDPELLEPVIEAFERMSPPARDYVIHSAAIVGSGWSSGGWTGAMPRRRQIIVIARQDPRDVVRTMLHEAAHVFLEPTPRGIARHVDTLHHLGPRLVRAGHAKPEWMDAVIADVDKVEQRAIALAAVWEHR